MSARNAGKAPKAKRFDPSLFVDAEYSNREVIVEMRGGPQENEVSVKAKITVCDDEDDGKVDGVLVHWEMCRHRFIDGHLTMGEPEYNPTSFRLDEIEAWVTSLYKAVQLGKARGYLPNIGAAK